jgi:hypothetical protein
MLPTFTPGDRVSTEWGLGTVTHASARRVVVETDTDGPINVVVGTPGYFRITKEA